ncbi:MULTISPECIES: amidase [Bradyrhizobium]|uniref:amidase n=1 Tax=Bradyrhizobium centrosematis TaxID=1300039 RepID=UPI00216A0084|nr:amidase [Bradyrhizobium centrosematis]MCS3765875.1 aspartyl-tRNA(Asn)/glutamyl-tRNA(Gln) amidotransferase subunit A [Bradyrhizobium centrosematis]MCS3778223.1 aspartyl-tRNA(Asn)/glutamyl-tRNA(Gln) amidotransferase subunit A [Bradyrhizobium centrosematis]
MTPIELFEMFWKRYERIEPLINAFMFVDKEGARRAAEEATVRQSSGLRLGPLDGIPIAIKDNLFVKGMPATWGSRIFEGYVPSCDDICVERLRAGGAILFGKTTTPEFALLGRTFSDLKPSTRNPWDLRLTSGGSSGGSVAAVASGMVPLSLGTDAGGSTRMPASYTGLVGLRPSNGRVPRRYGFLPMALDFQTIGLVGRSLADIDLLLSVIGGPDRRDPASVNLPPISTPHRPLRIGWFTTIGSETVDPEVARAHRDARGCLVSQGCQVEECLPPFNLSEINEIWATLAPVSVARVALSYPQHQGQLTDQIQELVRKGQEINATSFLRAIDRLAEFRAEVSAAWGEFDALLTPTAASPAWDAESACPDTIGGRPGTAATQSMFCSWVNAVGFCGLNIPGTPHTDGRPIGLQIVAPFGDDGLALHLGRMLEEASPWIHRRPSGLEES